MKLSLLILASVVFLCACEHSDPSGVPGMHDTFQREHCHGDVCLDDR
jgi:hypothetical protein